jgi:hypothetical protein
MHAIAIALPAALCAAALSAQEYAAGAIPSHLLEDAHTVVREEITRFEVKSEREGKLYWRRAATLLNDKSDANELKVWYDSQSKVNKIRAAVYDRRGQVVRRIESGEVKDFPAASGSLYQDDRVKLLEVKYHEYPYTVLFEYEQTMAGLRFAVFPDWHMQDYHTAVENSEFSVSVPRGFAFRYQALNFEGTPELVDDGKRQTFTWRAHRLPAVVRERHGPPAWRTLPAVLTAPERFAIDRYRGSMDSWDAFARFMHQLWAGRDVLPFETAAEARALVAGAVTNAEKIERLYRYLQRGTRYVSVQLGVGGWMPFDAAYVSQKKYGDCKALTNFMKALLREVGIEAQPALIRSGELFYEVSEDFATSRFNHVVLYIPEEDYWLECTSDHFPPNYLGGANADRNALLFSDQGGRLLRTPQTPSLANREDCRAEFHLRADGSAHIAATVLTEGPLHEKYRHLAFDLPKEEQEKWLVKNSALPTFALEALAIEPHARRPEAVLRYQANVRRYAAAAGKRLFVPIHLLSSAAETPPEMGKRRRPIVIRQGFNHRDTLIFHLPENYMLESAPEEKQSVDTDFGHYQLSWERTGPDSLRVLRALHIEPVELPAERYGEFRQFFLDVARLDSQKLVLIQKKP